MIYGQFTNWEPQAMVDIRDFCERIDLDKPDMLQHCAAKGLIPEGVEAVAALPPGPREAYLAEVEAFHESYRETWKGVV